jgi:arylsulfatase A-like enzyme
MNRKSLLSLVLSGLILLPQPGAAASRPNIVLILADDLGYGSLGCYGGAQLKTPACDRLAREGRRFTSAYAPGSVCSPSRYGLMTGRYIWRASVDHGYGLGERDALLIETNRATLASIARSCGYHTAAIGKWHNGLGLAQPTDWKQPLTPGPLAVGFEYFFGLAANVANQPQAYIEGDQLVGRVPGQVVTIEGAGKDRKTLGIAPLRKPDEVMEQLTGKAVQWIEANRAKPFFLYFAPNAVHDPITPSARFTGSPLGPYGNFIEELDDSVGRILAALDRLKLADNTLVIFTSDNGGVIQQNSSEHKQAMEQGLAINGVLRDGKHGVYEGGFREPFIVRWPGQVPANTVSAQIFCFTDLPATFAKILGAPLPAGSAEDSLDVSRAWLEAQAGAPVRTSVVLQAARASEYAIREGNWKFIEHENRPLPHFREKALHDAVMRQRQGMPKQDELFNLAADPSETKSVAAEHPEVVARLRKLLAAARATPATSRPPTKAAAAPAPNPVVCNRVRFFPALGGEQAMVGGRFEGSNVSRRDGFELLAEIKAVPPTGAWSELPLENTKVYRWLRYLGPRGSQAKLAELEFYAGDRKMSGPGGAYGLVIDSGGIRKNAFDGEAKTVFASSAADGACIGIDLRDAATARCPQFIPAPPAPPLSSAAPALFVHTNALEVMLKCATPGAVIRYTLDGTWPTEQNGTVYSAPLRIEKTATVQAASFLEGRAPSPPVAATYLVKGSVKPGQRTFHWGNSLTQTTSMLAHFIRTAGYLHRSAIFARPGAWTKENWDIGLVQEKERALGLWHTLDRLDHVTVQPRDFNIEEEAGYDIKFFDMAREKSPAVQPWLYCEWTELKRERPTDKGLVPSSQMKKTFPALTWEESMGAMLLYMEELQKKVCETYRTGKRPRVLPSALAMGWARNLIDRGQLPGIAPGSFYTLLFNDQVHPSSSPAVNEHANGGYLVDLTWFSAFYRESPEGKILPIGTTFTPAQDAILQRLAWEVIKNYPDCGLYEEGTEPCGQPEFVSDGKTITLKSATPGAWFRYTLDGTTPARTCGYVYCGVISVQPGIHLKAIAYKSGMADSAVSAPKGQP